MGEITVPLDELAAYVRGRRVGLLSNATVWLEQAGDDLAGVMRRYARETVLLYGEHGFRGDEAAADPAGTRLDAYTGCESRSLYEYGPTYRTEAIADLEALVVGVHDIGCRHYSYKRTMSYLLELAARTGKPVLVVDLPNPVRGDLVEGNTPDPAYYTEEDRGTPYAWFAAPIAYRHGMTIGELALYARDYLGLDVDLEVLRLEGWRRDMWWADTGWPWVPLDPSIYTPETAHAFLCTGLLQGTSVSWGIGAASPFALVGAPWMKDDRLLEALRARDLPGVTWTRAHFVPRWHEGVLWSRFADEPCNGVRLHFTDWNAVETAQVQLAVIVDLCRLYPDEFRFLAEYNFDIRLEDAQWVERWRSGEGVETILAEWRTAASQFVARRQPHLLYA